MEERGYYRALAANVLWRDDCESLLTQFSSYREGKSFSDVEEFRYRINGGGLEAATEELMRVVEINTQMSLRIYSIKVISATLS